MTSRIFTTQINKRLSVVTYAENVRVLPALSMFLVKSNHAFMFGSVLACGVQGNPIIECYQSYNFYKKKLIILDTYIVGKSKKKLNIAVSKQKTIDNFDGE